MHKILSHSPKSKLKVKVLANSVAPIFVRKLQGISEVFDNHQIVPFFLLTDDAGPPEQQPVPLSDLAPPPSSEELFGNIEELKEAHKQQIEEFEKAQSLNKTRMDQGLQEKLRARRSKRVKQKMQEEQSQALAKTSAKGSTSIILQYIYHRMCHFDQAGFSV